MGITWGVIIRIYSTTLEVSHSIGPGLIQVTLETEPISALATHRNFWLRV